MLDNDYSLPISFSMAAQIGLEETVLLTFLKQQAYLVNSYVIRVEMSQLSAQLPFWTVPVLMRLLANLQLSQLLDFQRKDELLEIQIVVTSHSSATQNSTAATVYPSTNHTSTNYTTTNYVAQAPISQIPVDKTPDSLMSKMDRLHKASREKHDNTMAPSANVVQPNNSVQPSNRAQPRSAPQQKPYPSKQMPRQYDGPPPPVANDRRGVTDFDLYLEQKERTRQPDQWQPEEATFEQITQAGIAREFALSLQPEFLLRIKEQRKNVRTWNSEFFKYVKRQWQYKQSDRSSYEGTSGSSTFTKTSREQVSDALTNIHDTDW